MRQKPVVLCILDGIGWGRRDHGDAVFVANTPKLDELSADHPWTLLSAHGTAVGMPDDTDMGNSEVGHNAMGAGRVFDQGATLVRNAISSGEIWDSPAWKKAVQGQTIHLIGLLSDGNVHSHVDHLLAMIARAEADGVQRLRVHMMSDGRDVSGRSVLEWLIPLEAGLASLNIDAALGSGGGRMHISMDRYEADWDMVERGFAVQVHGEGRRFPTAVKAVQTLYAEDATVDDQYLPAFVVGDHHGMNEGDSVVLFNFRGDRAIQLCQAFDDVEFSAFDRGNFQKIFFAGMMQYDGDLKIPAHFLVHPPVINNTVTEQLTAANIRSFAISETQKFGHVTYFFNGNRSDVPNAETWAEIPSLRVPFDQAPQMSASEVAKAACKAIRSGDFEHIRLNLANGDMVGHTGDIKATIAAVEHLDHCVGTLMEAVADAGGVMLVTADHGNADQMFGIDKKTGQYTDQAHTSHSLNPVPLWLFAPGAGLCLAADSGPQVNGTIAQIGGTLLDLLGLALPSEYLPSLIER
jgi:2,3-bisphosphoglycerate-independent phosphoglycerate mutase